MHHGHKIAVVIPAYNTERFIANVVRNIPDFVDGIYVVDDGSSDNTVEVIKGLNHPKLCLMTHKSNQGPGAALALAYKVALQDKMDILVKVDSDDQMPLDQIDNLINPIIEGRVDYTKGNRLSNPEHFNNMPRFRLFGNRLLTWLTRISSGYWHLNDSQNGFTAISATALRKIDLNLYAYYGYLNDMLVQLNAYHFRVLDVPMPAKYGQEKSSIKLGKYTFKISLLLLTRYFWRLKIKYVIKASKIEDLSKKGNECNIDSL